MEKVYCENCKHHFESWPEGEEYDEETASHYCDLKKDESCIDTPIKQEYLTTYEMCESKNAQNNCKDFEKKQSFWERFIK